MQPQIQIPNHEMLTPNNFLSIILKGGEIVTDVSISLAFMQNKPIDRQHILLPDNQKKTENFIRMTLRENFK